MANKTYLASACWTLTDDNETFLYPPITISASDAMEADRMAQTAFLDYTKSQELGELTQEQYEEKYGEYTQPSIWLEGDTEAEDEEGIQYQIWVAETMQPCGR